MIRKLQLKDANRMYLCLTDFENMQYMRLTKGTHSIENCEKFIRQSFSETDQHFAIVDEDDEWIGTISLKNIDYDVGMAEYAIITDKSVHGKGYALYATRELLKYAFDILKLNRVYLNVVKDNIRANKFYIKCGFIFEGCFRQAIKISDGIHDLNWYSILRTDE